MKTLLYSPDFKERKQALCKYLDFQFGKDVRKRVMAEIHKQILALRERERLGLSVRDNFGINCDYYYIVISKNILFYRFDSRYIYIVNIYNERKDYIYKMFGSFSQLHEEAFYQPE